MDSWQNCCLPVTVRTIHKLLSSIKLCTSFQLSFVHYINIYSRIVIQLNKYVKIITSSGFKSTILTDFVQGQLRVRFRFGRLPAPKKPTKNRSRIYNLGVVPTRGNYSLECIHEIKYVLVLFLVCGKTRKNHQICDQRKSFDIERS